MLNKGTDTEIEVTFWTEQQKPSLSPSPRALGPPHPHPAAGLEPTPPHPVSPHPRAREESGAQPQVG